VREFADGRGRNRRALQAQQIAARRYDRPRPEPDAAMSTLIYTHDACFDHRPGPHHPESPERLQAVLAALKAPEFAEVLWREAPLGSLDQVRHVHTAAYVEHVEALSPREGYRALDSGDTIMSPGTLAAVLRCVGAACAGVDAVMSGLAANVFCATRPCGHHAEPGRAMGFCIFNQAAIAAAYAYEVHKVSRIAVVDFDVHHGNGTQDAFYDRPEMLYASSHQSPFYPGTGSAEERGQGDGIGFTLNVPLAAGSGDAEYKKAFEEKLKPAAAAFKPDFVLISAGFDAARDDLLGRMKITPDGYAALTRIVNAIANQYCQGRLVSVLEGGYNLDALARSVEAHVRVLMESNAAGETRSR
jgi:acetoin utilization deacetylase AcuC-like enzyme